MCVYGDESIETAVLHGQQSSSKVPAREGNSTLVLVLEISDSFAPSVWTVK
jgi:hypothetical protein